MKGEPIHYLRVTLTPWAGIAGKVIDYYKIEIEVDFNGEGEKLTCDQVLQLDFFERPFDACLDRVRREVLKRVNDAKEKP